MKRHLLSLLALCMTAGILNAYPVDVKTAKDLGLKFVQHKSEFSSRNVVNDITLNTTYRSADGLATFYVFDVNDGFVMVAADDCSRPILGYSNEGAFDLNNAPDGLLFMLDELSNGIAAAVKANIPANSDIVCQWKNLEAHGFLHPEKGNPYVHPLIQLKWNQDYPYNMFVPSGCPTGCVATALAQIMKYWEWPVTGTGEHSYFCAPYGEQYANFGATTYDWEHMTPTYGGISTDEEKIAVATLMYHCGVAMNMQYEPSGSGAFSADVPEAIATYFSYSDHATHITKAGNTLEDWHKILKINLDQQVPVYYSGQSTSGGHAFVCDGYDSDDLFHFNWGWGGSSNGYFAIDGPDFDYTGSQAIIFDMVPNYLYDQMPNEPLNLEVSIDSDVSLIGHLTWTNPTTTLTGETLSSIDKIVVRRNGIVVKQFTDVTPGQTMSCDDEVPYFDQFEYTVCAINDVINGRAAVTHSVFGPYCEWKIVMTSAGFHGWDGGGITVQNAAGTYIDFLTTSTSASFIQKFQMALGNNNLYWTAPASAVSNLSFKIKDSENQLVAEYDGPSSGIDAGLITTLNNSCGNENNCVAPYNLVAVTSPDNDQDIKLNWSSDQAPEFGYCIYRDGFLCGMSHTTEYVDVNTEIGGHCYYITTLSTGGETTPSNEYCATSGTGCEPPTDLYAEYTNNNRVQLYWTAPENENLSGYFIYRKTDDTPYKRLKVTTTTAYKDNSAAPGNHYYYTVIAYYEGTQCSSAYSTNLFNHDQFFIDVNWEQTLNELMANYDEDEHAVKLVWQPAYQAQTYTIYRNGEAIGTVDYHVSFTDTDVIEGETYCYTVTASVEGSEISTSETCITISGAPVLPCNAPTELTGSFGSNNDVIVTWQIPADRTPEKYLVTKINNQTNDTTYFYPTVNEYREELVNDETYDCSFSVQAVYDECISEYATTQDGEEQVRISNLGVVESNNAFNVYPNPTEGQLTIQAHGFVNATLYNTVGQKVTTTKQPVLSLENLPNGVYFLQVTTETNIFTEKIIKK